MPNKYIKSKKADRDIFDIYKKSAETFGTQQTDKYLEGLEYSLQLLADSPDLGRSCDYLRKNYHRHEYKSHIIFYKKRKNDIFIMRIIHKSRDYKNHI